MNNAGSITPPKHPSVNLNVRIVNECSNFVEGPSKYKWHIPRLRNRPTWLNNVMHFTSTQTLKTIEVLVRHVSVMWFVFHVLQLPPN